MPQGTEMKLDKP